MVLPVLKQPALMKVYLALWDGKVDIFRSDHCISIHCPAPGHGFFIFQDPVQFANNIVPALQVIIAMPFLAQLQFAFKLYGFQAYSGSGKAG